MSCPRCGGPVTCRDVSRALVFYVGLAALVTGFSLARMFS